MTPAERKTLAFFAAIAALGAGARAAGLGAPPAAVVSSDPPADERAALDRQLAAVDSARASRQRRPKGRVRAPGRRAAVTGDTAASLPPYATTIIDRRPLTPATSAADTRTRISPPTSPVDVDRADSAALDALPGVGPALARRIVADRATHGPFGSMAGLSRVAGIGPGLEGRLQPFVTFSGRPGGGPPRWPP